MAVQSDWVRRFDENCFDKSHLKRTKVQNISATIAKIFCNAPKSICSIDIILNGNVACYEYEAHKQHHSKGSTERTRNRRKKNGRAATEMKQNGAHFVAYRGSTLNRKIARYPSRHATTKKILLPLSRASVVVVGIHSHSIAIVLRSNHVLCSHLLSRICTCRSQFSLSATISSLLFRRSPLLFFACTHCLLRGTCMLHMKWAALATHIHQYNTMQ